MRWQETDPRTPAASIAELGHAPPSADTFEGMASNPRLRTWVAASGRHDDRVLDAQQVALFIADSGWSAPGEDDAALAAAIRIDDRLSDDMVELREDDLYYLSTRTAAREANGPYVTVIDGLTGESMAQGWLEPELAAAADHPGPATIQPFVAARPSGLSEDSIGHD